MSLTDRIRARLAATGKKPGRASRDAGLGHTYVRDLLQGKVTNPRTEHLARLAVALETTPEWLAAGRGIEAPTEAQIDLGRVETLLRRIAPEDLPQAERALRGFVREEKSTFSDAPAKPRKRRKKEGSTE